MELEAIKAAIKALKPLAGQGKPRPSISFVLGPRKDTGIWTAIRALGGRAESTLYEYEDREPLVIESMDIQVDGVEVRIQRTRPPVAEEIESKRGTYTQASSFQVSTV